ncbi:hypothetical protein BASA83_009454 [Batrachochytrium salamandrivorans]|nr:hypothetical protein BASA83_009454 [Batrachochytrium salamandrivorans]
MGAAESKLAFRKNVFALYEQQSIPQDNQAFWDSFLQLPETPENVFNLISPKDVRKIIQEYPDNIKMLARKASSRILAFAQLTTHPQPQDIKEVLNAVRILTRILPFIFELEDGGALETLMFWSEDISDAKPASPADDTQNSAPTLGSRLAEAVVQLLFFQRFTLPDLNTNAENIHYAIWSKGVGATEPFPTSRDEASRRIEVLRLLFTMMSRTLYCKPDKLFESENRWAIMLTSRLEKKPVLALLCSLINTISAYDPTNWASLPYNHLLFEDMQEPLVSICIQTLTVLLDYKSWEQPSVQRTRKPSFGKEHSRSTSEDQIHLTTNTPSASNMTGSVNDFRYYVGKLHKFEDFEHMSAGIVRLLRNPLDAGKVYLPGSTRKISITTELMTLIWVLINTNEKFLQHIVGPAHIIVIIEALLGVCLEVRREPARAGALRLACFILHILSQERGFGVALNEPFEMASSVYVILSTTGPMRPVILSLQEPLLVVLANASPMVKSLTATTANKLISLFDVFSSPAFLLSKEHNYRLLYYLLDIFNNIVQYQFVGNSQLIYSLVRHRDQIGQLFQMTLQSAITEVGRMRVAETKRLAALGRSSTTTELAEVSTAKADTARESVAPSSATEIPEATPLEKEKEDISNDNQPTDSGSLEKETAPNSADQHMSEKAMGKLPDPSQFTDDKAVALASSNPELAPVSPQVFQSKCGFRPTEEWFHSWRSQLPLLVLLTLSDYLRPRIEQFCIDNGLNDDRKVVEFLSRETVVGVLPQPHLIMMRSFTYSDPMHIWFTSYFWGTVYLKATESVSAETAKLCPPIWLGTSIQLFHVRLNALK